jgi:hypothetical protein
VVAAAFLLQLLQDLQASCNKFGERRVSIISYYEMPQHAAPDHEEEEEEEEEEEDGD